MEIPDFVCSVLPEFLTMGVKSQFRFTVTNYSDQTITFANDDGIDIDDFPGIHEAASEKNLSCLYLYLNFGDEGGDLVSQQDSSRISINLVDAPGWKIRRYPDPTYTYYWKITPRSTLELKAHECIAVVADTVLVNNALGPTPIRYKYRKQSTLLDGSVNLNKLRKKLRKPVIQSFGIKETDYDVGQPVEFQWQVQNSEGCSITLDNRDVTGLTAKSLPIENKTYHLIMRSPSGFAAQMSVTPVFIYIVSFTVAGNADEKKLTLRWETRNCSLCEIDNVSGLGPGGTLDYPLGEEPRAAYSVTLKAYPVDGTAVKSQTIQFSCPRITRFVGVDEYHFGLNDQALTGEKELLAEEGDRFVPPEALAARRQIPVVGISYEGTVTHLLGVRWTVENAASCELVGVASSLNLPSGYYDTNRHGTYTLCAHSNTAGLYAQRTMTF